MPNPPEPTRPWWKSAARFVRKRAIVLIFLVCAVKLAGDLGADWAWWLETPVHFQLQYAMLLTLGLTLLLLSCGLLWQFTRWAWLALAAGVLVGGHAALTVLALTPAQQVLAPPQQQARSSSIRVRVLSANVYTGNHDHESVLRLIQDEQPDLVLLMELNTTWVAALEPLHWAYPFHRVHADDGGNFGIDVWSRLSVDHVAFEGFGWGLPQVHMVLRAKDKDAVRTQQVRFFGLHPLPPVSAENVAHRDRIGVEVARLAEAEPRLPLVVVGDLNNTRFTGSFRRLCNEAELFDAGHGSGVWRTWLAGSLPACMARGSITS